MPGFMSGRGFEEWPCVAWHGGETARPISKNGSPQGTRFGVVVKITFVRHDQEDVPLCVHTDIRRLIPFIAVD